jgi:hypothetical protein
MGRACMKADKGITEELVVRVWAGEVQVSGSDLAD